MPEIYHKCYVTKTTGYLTLAALLAVNYNPCVESKPRFG